MEFIYDNSGVFGVKYNNEQYFYRKDAQGNIIALLDEAGSIVVKYVYDAWGNHAVLDCEGHDIEDNNHIGNVNPFRYRGYYFDTETGFYYLQTRYYDPEVGRFISQDSIEYADPETINGLNLYAYCGNNPVMYADPNGTAKWWEWLLLGLAIVVVVAAAAVATVATGGLALVAGGIAIGGALGGLTSIVGQGLTNGWDNISIGGIAAGIFLGGAIGGAIGLAAAAGLIGLGAGGLAGLGGSSLALAGGGTVAVGLAAASVAALGIGILFAKWERGTWPGDDPTVSPGDGFEWRGRGPAGSNMGNWYNPFTGETLHPDLNHLGEIGPHWDYKDIFEIWYRIFKNGGMFLK